MTSPQGIGQRRAYAQRDALIGLRASMNGAGLRCLIVERVRVVMAAKFGPRIYLPPYMEVRRGTRLLVTISVSERMGRDPHFVITPPGRQGFGFGVGDIQDAASTAKHLRSVRQLADVTTDEGSEPV
ncbi:hypothetical protein DQ384_22370 [Sphaerisporangium album]|uniref:Uncharacterized protein n=1 Tax=Sphaerisporangium album TaxID=509200 RepID=A0A367FHF8_9ACTN|nr:hypothetical protein [Sphaerisporangium album]RCG29085.1 hypothetical protein DQ384_22370 [Sphaerisporangium album]